MCIVHMSITVSTRERNFQNGFFFLSSPRRAEEEEAVLRIFFRRDELVKLAKKKPFWNIFFGRSSSKKEFLKRHF